MDNKLITAAFVISERDLAEIKAEADMKGLNKSAMLRVILSEWRQLRVVGFGELPHPADAQPVPVIYVERAE